MTKKPPAAGLYLVQHAHGPCEFGLVGIFDSLEAAGAACTTQYDFIQPMLLNRMFEDYEKAFPEIVPLRANGK